MSIVDRLKQYMEYIGMPSTQFADVAKISRPTISQILNGRNRKISNEIIAKIHEGFPSLNIMWLLFGDGDIELSTNTQISEAKRPSSTTQKVAQPTVTQQQNWPAMEFEAPQIPLRTSNIDEFVEENTRRHQENTTSANTMSQVQQIAAADTQRRIRTIMVFYNDSSFEIFAPTKV